MYCIFIYYCRRKQELSERRRNEKVKERLSLARKEEREKVEAGKQPYYMKASEKKTMLLEEKYNELKKEGRLNQFMEKRRKKNSNKDHRWMPERRSFDGDNIQRVDSNSNRR